ncbi:hypothetical protein P9730_001421 [Raoultella ornithinolytica]|uniref:hypothetical protein n=1 Tax=Raoultella ornithinolytica TaxID=54291 RepID=UPI002A67205F|nr:hypothetical protein [Raoultella ornithinolytica]EKR9382792.1 hypothetical protein [Raoultella ornithinolytica]MEB6435119.1 hypothetical protein [Raoultella ornithinolytica]
MTDITELAQRLNICAKEGTYPVLSPADCGALLEALEKSEKTSEARREAIDITHKRAARERDRANAAEEALEKAQQVDEELCRLLPPGVEYMDPPDGGDVTPLEGVCRMVADYRLRIADLESRTVKLPDDEDGQAYGFGKWSNRKLPATAGTMTIAYCEDAWRAAFEVFSSAAGIKVEAE